jgi:hypothetical protein
MSLPEPQQERRFTLLNVLLLILLLISPLLVAQALVNLRFDAEMSDFVPHVWNDQNGFWHYTLTFAEAGFKGGYYVLNEQLSDNPWAKWDVKGPVYPMTYGTIAKLTGWDTHTGIYINASLLGIAGAALALLLRLNWRQKLLLLLLLNTFWVVPEYILTISQETPLQIFAILLAGAAYLLIYQREKLAWWHIALILLGLCYTTLLRFSWALMFLPFLYLALPLSKRKQPLWVGLIVVVSAVSAILMIAFYRSLIVGSLNSVYATVEPGGSSLSDRFSNLYDTARVNGEYFFEFEPGIAVVQNIQLLGGLLLVAIAFLYKFFRQKDRLDSPGQVEQAFHLYNLGILLGSSLTVYTSEGFFRLYGIYLLMSMVLLILSKRYALASMVIAMNILVLPSFLSQVDQWQGNFSFDKQHLDEETALFHEYVRYDPDAPSDWCNTTLINLRHYGYQTTAIPAGVGIAWVWERPGSVLTPPIRSNYFMLSKDEYADFRTKYGVSGQLKAEFSFANVYYNKASDCERPAHALDEQLNLDPAQYEAYSSHIADLEWLQEPIFNPFRDPSSEFSLSAQDSTAFWAAYLNLVETSPEEQGAVFELMALWNHFSSATYVEDQEAVGAWATTKSAEDLRALGFEYIMLTDNWTQYFSEEELRPFTDEIGYEHVTTIQNPSTGEEIQIFKVAATD